MLQNNLGAVAALLSQSAGSRSYFDRRWCGVSLRCNQNWHESTRQLQFLCITAGRFLQRLDPFKPLLQLGLCFAEGRTFQGLFAGQRQIPSSIGGIVGTGVMMREFGQMVVERVGINIFERPANSLVQLLAAIYQDRIVGNLLGQGVLEDILSISRYGLLINKLARAQLREPLVQ